MESVCKRCLLKDMTDSEYYISVYEYINSLPEHTKTEQVVYEKRLEACRLCENLINGMCKLCGCFVEVRASKKVNYCAKSSDIW